MEPVTDIDRAIHDALQVQPAADFAARVRARVSVEPPEQPVSMPRLVLVAAAFAVLAILATTISREAVPLHSSALLPYRDLVVFSAPPQVLTSRPVAAPRTSAASPPALNVMVSRSEMVALQRLFSGLTSPPPAAQPIADELLIPELAIEPIAPFTTGPEGERK